MWLLNLVLEPARVALAGLWRHVMAFVQASDTSKAWALGVTLAVACVFPTGLVLASVIPLSYTTGHPLLRIGWDLALVVLLAEVATILPIVLIPLSAITFYSLGRDIAIRAQYYKEKQGQQTEVSQAGPEQRIEPTVTH